MSSALFFVTYLTKCLIRLFKTWSNNEIWSSVSGQVIDPSKSRVNLMGTKVEVNLKKMEPGSWSSLELSVPTESANGNS